MCLGGLMKKGMALAFVVILGLAACGGRAAQTKNGPAPRGTAAFADRLAMADEFSLAVSGLPSLSGDRSYQAWLVGSDGQTYLGLGPVKIATDGSLALRWDSPTSENLAAHYAGFEVTVESGTVGAAPKGPVAFSGSLSALGRSLFGPSTTSPSPAAIGMKQQADLAVEHGRMAIAAQQIKAWDEMRAHLEHVINILEGTKGKRFGDYLGTGVPQNPGDGYGVGAYEQDLVSLLGKDAAAGAGVSSMDEAFHSAMSSLEDACLAALKLKGGTKADQSMRDVKLRMDALQNGPVADLYRAAQKELSVTVGPRS